MTAHDLIVASNKWAEPFWSQTPLCRFLKKYPWTGAFLILFFAMSIGFFRTEQLSNSRVADLQERRSENLARDRQFCKAIPDVALTSAQGLVRFRKAVAKRQGATVSELADIERLGRVFEKETRRLTLAKLPECLTIIRSP